MRPNRNIQSGGGESWDQGPTSGSAPSGKNQPFDLGSRGNEFEVVNKASASFLQKLWPLTANVKLFWVAKLGEPLEPAWRWKPIFAA